MYQTSSKLSFPFACAECFSSWRRRIPSNNLRSMVWRPCDGQADPGLGCCHISGLFSCKVDDIITHLRHQRDQTLGFVSSPKMTRENRWSHFIVDTERCRLLVSAEATVLHLWTVPLLYGGFQTPKHYTSSGLDSVQ